MRKRRMTAAALAAGMTVCQMLGTQTAAETALAPVTGPEPVYNEEGYDISGFAWQWPEVFSKDDTVTVTDTSYQSHDVRIDVTRHDEDRMTGDIDENGTVDVRDAVQLSRLIGEDSTLNLEDTGKKNADVDEDGVCGPQDLTKMLQYLSQQLTDSEFFIDHKLVYFVTEVYVRDIRSLRGGFAGGTYTLPSAPITQEVVDMAKDNNALFAINCDYVAFRTNGITYRNGVMYREDPSTYKHDVCVIYQDGVMDILKDAEYRALTDEQKAEIWQTSAFSPALVVDGTAVSGMKGQLAIQHPRSGMGYYEPGHYVFLMVEGRQPGYSVGVTLDQYAQMFADLGVQQAYNFDGGSSSVIAFMGSEVNHTAWSGRKSSDILYICELSQIPVDTAAEQFLAAKQAETEPAE